MILEKWLKYSRDLKINIKIKDKNFQEAFVMEDNSLLFFE